MELEIKILKQGKEILITDKTNKKEVGKLVIEGSMLLGVPKGDYHKTVYGILHNIQASGRPMDMKSLGLNQVEIANLLAANYLSENKTGGMIEYSQE